MEIIFATNNKNKLLEVREILSKDIRLRTLRDENILEEIPEPYFTFRENAWAKATFVKKKTNKPCFSEDSGLVVPFLNNEPGVFSARYAGTPSNDEKNNIKLLDSLNNIEERNAYYQTSICLIYKNDTFYFDGKCYGKITFTPKGHGGFGYDPLFIPEGYTQTFAELSLEVKNKISHRAKAVNQLVQFLNNHLNEQ